MVDGWFSKFVLGLVCFCSFSLALAYPPSPSFSVSGIVRDEFGWGYDFDSGAEIILKLGEQEIGRQDVGRVIFNENFRFEIPVDLEQSTAYVGNAQVPGNELTVHFELRDTELPLQGAEIITVGKPGESIRLDLTVGEDSDDDGLPDSWELWQLEQAGIDREDERFNLETLGTGDFDGDGFSDYAEFLAGTSALSKDDFLDLRVVKTMEDGWQEYEFFMVVDKVYKIERSVDLKNWEQVATFAGTDREAQPPIFRAKESSLFAFQRPPATEGKSLYRVVVR